MLINRSMPRCTVIPQIAYPDVGKAAEWLCNAFGFTVRIRIADHRIQMNVGDGAIVLTKLEGAPRPSSVMVRVKNVDQHYDHVVKYGVTVETPPKEHFYGEKQYGVVDFAGHQWKFSESIADVAPEAWGGEAVELR